MGPATRGSLLMLTDILLASPTRESKALIIVFSPLLLNSGTLYLNLSFLTLTTCRRLRGRSIITFGGLNVLFYVEKSFFFKPFLHIFYSLLSIFFTLFINSLQPELDKGIRAHLGAAVLLFRGTP